MTFRFGGLQVGLAAGFTHWFITGGMPGAELLARDRSRSRNRSSRSAGVRGAEAVFHPRICPLAPCGLGGGSPVRAAAVEAARRVVKRSNKPVERSPTSWRRVRNSSMRRTMITRCMPDSRRSSARGADPPASLALGADSRGSSPRSPILSDHQSRIADRSAELITALRSWPRWCLVARLAAQW